VLLAGCSSDPNKQKRGILERRRQVLSVRQVPGGGDSIPECRSDRPPVRHSPLALGPRLPQVGGPTAWYTITTTLNGNRLGTIAGGRLEEEVWGRNLGKVSLPLARLQTPSSIHRCRSQSSPERPSGTIDLISNTPVTLSRTHGLRPGSEGYAALPGEPEWPVSSCGLEAIRFSCRRSNSRSALNTLFSREVSWRRTLDRTSPS